MKFLHFLFADKSKSAPPAQAPVPVPPGQVVTHMTNMTLDIARAMQQRFIAFDVEATGLDTHTDRIIELGAVLFENGVAVRTFGTLVNAHAELPAHITELTGITSDMLAAAPPETEVYPALLDFLGDAASGQTFLCAHHARFDLDILRHNLVRLGFSAEFRYVDTLPLSWKYLPKAPNHKQPTLAQYLQIDTGHTHRAMDDARVCGQVFLHMLPLILTDK